MIDLVIRRMIFQISNNPNPASSRGVTVLNLLEVLVRPVDPLEEPGFQKLMQAHHYLGAFPKISETLWYVATLADQWLALLSFSAAALKCSARNHWI
jgi:hypothetical protein